MRGLVKAVAAALVLTGSVWGTVRAEQASGQDAKVSMGEVVVTASRESEPTAKVPANVTVIDAVDIENSTAQNVPELLAAAGLFVTDAGGYKRSYTVDLRGFGESAPANTLVLVDGRRINQADLTGTDWTLIPLDRIDRIEIVPGPRGSVLYGDNATGGVINIITKEGSGLEGRATVQYGSYNTSKGATGLSGASGIVSYDISASYLDSEGYRDNSDTEAKDAGATLRLDPSEFFSFNFSGGYHKDKTGLPGSILQSQLDAGFSPTHTFNPKDFAETEDYYGKIGAELFFLTNDSFRIEGSYRNRSFDTFYTFPDDSVFEGNTEIDTMTVSPSFVFQESFGEVSNRILMGMDFVRAWEDVKDSGGQRSELDKDNIGYYIHDDLGVTRNLTLSGGYRYDRAEFDLFTAGDFFGTPYVDRADRTLDEESFTFGINYAIGSAKVYATYGKSFRYPLLDEFFNYNTFTFNADLKPQRSKTWEVGTQFDLSQAVKLRINMFGIVTKDEIFYNPNTFANENLDGDTERNGFEVSVGYLQNGWVAGANYTYTNAEIDGGLYEDSTIPNVPKHKATANLGYDFDMGLFLGLNAIYVGERYLISDFTNTYKKQDEYVLVNAKVKYDWRWLSFFVDVNNLFDKEYASYGGVSFAGEPGYYPSPEVNFLAGVTARFGGI